MNTNTILSKSIDNQTTKNPLQSLQDKKEQKQKLKKQPKLILSIPILYFRFDKDLNRS